MILHKNIRKMRKSKDMTQAQLANVLKVSRSTIAMWETNRATSKAEAILKLTQMFGCTVDELLQMEAKGNEPDDAA